MQHKNKTLQMKKLLLILIFTQFLFGCSKDELPENEPSILEHENILDKLRKEYNITKEGLFLESASNGIDTMQLFINGRFNESLWIGCYDKTTKKQIFEWIEKDKLDTIFHLNIGYGEYSDLKVKVFQIKYPYYSDGQLHFVLWGYNPDIPTNLSISGRIISSDLYFIKNNKLLKKQRSFTYPIESFYQDIKPWFNSIFSKYQDNTNICFSASGDSLFSFNNVWSTIERSEPISIEECIELNASFYTSNVRDFHFKRHNLKTKETLWENENKPLNNIPNDDRLDSTIIGKNNNIWTYSFFLTSFSDGAKYIKQIDLDIETGESIFKE